MILHGRSWGLKKACEWANMIIWEAIVSDAELLALYSSRGVEPLAEHLGVSRNTLRNKLVSLGVTFRSRGGANFKGKDQCKLDGITLKEIEDKGAEAIAELRQVDVSLVYKLKRRLQNE